MTATALAIEVSVRCAGWGQALPHADKLVGAAARLALGQGMIETAVEPRRRVEISVILADDGEQRRLNRDWRGIDRSTNVLAFPAWDPAEPSPADAPLLLGDVVLAYETVTREAQEQHKTLADHLRHLVVHGVLHLLGYDHATEAEAAVMETLEALILAGLGVEDPYRRTM